MIWSWNVKFEGAKTVIMYFSATYKCVFLENKQTSKGGCTIKAKDKDQGSTIKYSLNSTVSNVIKILFCEKNVWWLSSITFSKRSFGVYRNHPVCLSVCLSVHPSVFLVTATPPQLLMKFCCQIRILYTNFREMLKTSIPINHTKYYIDQKDGY